MNLLAMREGYGREFASAVAESTLGMGSRDVRYAVNLARLSRAEENLPSVLDTLRRRR